MSDIFNAILEFEDLDRSYEVTLNEGAAEFEPIKKMIDDGAKLTDDEKQ